MSTPSLLSRRLVAALALAAIATLLRPAPAAGQMPDISQMSGVPLPTGDLPTGTVSVRVVRGDLSNNVVGQAVELHGGGPALRAATDDTGRAQFAGVAPGTRVHAVTTVDGRRLESQEFQVPAAGASVSSSWQAAAGRPRAARREARAVRRYPPHRRSPARSPWRASRASFWRWRTRRLTSTTCSTS